MKGLMQTQARETYKGIDTMGAQIGYMISKSKKKRDMPAEHGRRPGLPATGEMFDSEDFEKNQHMSRNEYIGVETGRE